MGECLGICNGYDTTAHAGYAKGYKWCTRCHLFIRVSGVMCPCCKTQLRVRSFQCPTIEVKRIG